MEDGGDRRRSRKSKRSGERKRTEDDRRRQKEPANVHTGENSDAEQPMNPGNKVPEKENSAQNLEAEISAEDPYATSAIFVCTDDQTKHKESEKDLSSPDSNDSGIQADAAQSFHHLSNDCDDLYGVVKKPKRKPVSHTLDGRCPPDSMTEVTSDLQGTVMEREGFSPTVKQRKNHYDPHATVKMDSEEDDNGEAVVRNKTKTSRVMEHIQNLSNSPVAKQRKSLDDPYETFDDADEAVVRNKTKAMKIIEESDDSDDCDDNGNHHFNNYNGHCDDNDDRTKTESLLLPEGWQRHEDESGSYYWHIKSGEIQREPPSRISAPIPAVRKSKAEIRHLATTDLKVSTKAKEMPKYPFDADVELETRKQNHSASGITTSSANRFLVHCQGSVPLAEEDLAEDRSGLTINQCISSLTHQRSIMQPGKLQGLDLYLEFIGDQLTLTDVRTDSVVSSESVKSIRVWGVGREKDSRDFAYVSFDPARERHTCWVFSCEKTGHEVASALRRTCYKILKENEAFAARMAPALARTQNSGVYESQVSRESQKSQLKNWSEGVVFPAPMNETKKVINCHYLGMMKVKQPTGMGMLNDAMEMIFAGVPSSKWVSVTVEVAPSAVTVFDRANMNSIIFECRIRFLTFLGICINNCKLVAFIMNSAQDEFFAHVFHCIPDAGLFCQTIKAACKLRYQKCLDAQAQKEQDRGKPSRQATARNPLPFQGLRESFQKKVISVSSLFGGNNKKQQQKG